MAIIPIKVPLNAVTITPATPSPIGMPLFSVDEAIQSMPGSPVSNMKKVQIVHPLSYGSSRIYTVLLKDGTSVTGTQEKWIKKT